MFDSNNNFLRWLYRRLENVHNYDSNSEVLTRFRLLLSNQEDLTTSLSDDQIDMIIGQYFIDFNLTKDDTCDIGYSEDQRKSTREAIKKIALDIYYKRVPKDTLK